ncbi:MAG TPA: HEAT repeat domain-containing protein [Pyrinomonadaceae bacterium]|jgi:biotin carboxyl carrier protein|nr:HEAT repeat domain-containing protein [Pyrinomonadaceae bacterium]
MSANGFSANGGRGGETARAPSGRRRMSWPLAVVATLFVVVPFLTWYWTWFGRSLSDEEMRKFLTDGNPRHAQHAMSQLADRITEDKDDEAARRWGGQVVALASSPVADVRMTAAWLMGVEHKSEEFHAALSKLVEDGEPIVRRNAALALVRFGDERCRPELLAMLRPFAVRAAAGGTAMTALSAGTPVKRESLLVRYRSAEGSTAELRSPVPGRVERASVREGESFEAGAELFHIAPDAEQVRDALLGLYYFGRPEDLPEIERYERGVEHMTDDVKRQAALTAREIKSRKS